MEAEFCPDCGQTIQKQAKKCPKCGRPKKPVSVWKVNALLLVLLCGVYFISEFISQKREIAELERIAELKKLAPTSISPKPVPPKVTASTPSQKEMAIGAAIMDFKWHKSAERVFLADITIQNYNEFAVKDILIECNQYGRSETKIVTTTKIIFDTFPPGKSKSIKNFNIGLLHSQTSFCSCQILDLKW